MTLKYQSINTYILLGDMNADFNTVNGQRLRQMCSRHNLCYLTEEPTRITETSATILDQVLTNAPTFVKGIDVLDPVSTNDHCTITLHLNFRISRESAYTRLIWQYDKADLEGFHKALTETDFEESLSSDDIDLACASWTEMFIGIAKRYIPNRVVTIRPRDSPWYTNALRLMKRKLHRLLRKFKNSKKDSDWANYKELRNTYQSRLDEAEREYNLKLSSSLASSCNTKTWWTTVKHMLGRGGGEILHTQLCQLTTTLLLAIRRRRQLLMTFSSLSEESIPLMQISHQLLPHLLE